MEKITMQLNPPIFELFKETFNIEVEILKGECFQMADGRFFVEIHVSDEKLEMFKEFLKICMAKPSDEISITYFGTKINQN